MKVQDMKLKNKLTYHNVYMKLRIFVFAFCLMVLPFDLLSFMSGSASANSNNMVKYNLEQEVQPSAIIGSEDARKSLWQENITPAKEQQQVQKDVLQSLIEQINAMQLSLPSQAFEPSETAVNILRTEPEKSASQNENSEQAVRTANINTQYESISEPTIRKLRKLAEKPEEIDNPYAIGNTLFLSNYVGEAASFYQEALRRNKPDDMTSSEDRAWLLFQTANSLQNVDMAAAADEYQKLITGFPNSPWADIARVQSNLIRWYTEDKPQELLTEYKR